MIKHLVFATVAAGTLMTILPTPAKADPPWVREERHRRWEHENWERRHGNYYRRDYRPVYHVPPPAYYAPPQAYYAPPAPAYVAPGINLYVPLR